MIRRLAGTFVPLFVILAGRASFSVHAALAAQVGCEALGSWIDGPGIPACPRGDNTILPANYPNLAYVVSDDTAGKQPAAQAFTESVVLGILRNSGDRVPLILLPVSNETYSRLQFMVRDYVSRHPRYSGKLDAWLKALILSKGPRWTWQQDYFESFIDPGTGLPVLRQVDAYLNRGPNVRQLASDANHACPLIKQGQALLSPPAPPRPQVYYGGNIEGLPGGLCLHGDDQPREYARQYCGSKENEVVIPDSWLVVGHVDEISAVVHKPGASSPCDFAIELASPKLALDLLKKSPNEKFFDFFAQGEFARSDLRYRANNAMAGGVACSWVRDHPASRGMDSTPKKPAQPPSKTDSGSVGKLWLKLRDSVALRWSRSAWADGGSRDCAAITNGQVVTALEGDSNAKILNELVQDDMDKARARIAARIRQRLPQCAIDFIDIPQIFSGGAPVERRGSRPGDPLERRYELPVQMLTSVLPNGTNALVVGDAVLTPHPQNGAFARYLSQALAAAGLRTEFIDTYDYAHVYAGNLHCSTHSLPFCRAGPEKGR